MTFPLTKAAQILGVPHDATEDEIKKAHQRYARLYHPDRQKSSDLKELAEAKLKEINLAFETLKKFHGDGISGETFYHTESSSESRNYEDSSYGDSEFGNTEYRCDDDGDSDCKARNDTFTSSSGKNQTQTSYRQNDPSASTVPDQLKPSAVRPVSNEPGFDDFAYKPIPPLAPVSALLGVCSLAGLLSPLGLVFAVVGLALGFVGLRQIKQAEGGLGGRTIATVGVALSAVLFLSSAALHIYWYQTEVPEGFQRISFGSDISRKGFINEDGERRAHDDVAALAGKPLFVKCFMYPEERLDGISTFILCRDNGQCCFGGQPKLEDMIKVKLVDGLTAQFSNHMVSVAGVFRLRDLRKAGNLEPPFELEATHFGPAKTSY